METKATHGGRCVVIRCSRVVLIQVAVAATHAGAVLLPMLLRHHSCLHTTSWAPYPTAHACENSPHATSKHGPSCDSPHRPPRRHR